MLTSPTRSNQYVISIKDKCLNYVEATNSQTQHTKLDILMFCGFTEHKSSQTKPMIMRPLTQSLRLVID